MVCQLAHLAAQCTTMWQRKLHRPLAAAPMQDFLGRFFTRRRLEDPRSNPHWITVKISRFCPLAFTCQNTTNPN